MNKLRISIVFILFTNCISCFINDVFAQAPKWVNYSKDFMFKDIDIDGNYIWISTNGGLVRYDKLTNTSTILTPAVSGITNGNINNLLIASNGDKWVSTNSAGLLHYDGNTWTSYYNVGSGNIICHAFATAEDPSGNIWISSNPDSMAGTINGSELFKFNGTSFTKYTVPNGDYIKDLTCDSFGNIWIAGYNALHRFDGTTWTEFSPSNSTIEGYPHRVLADSNNNIWATVTTVNGSFACMFDGVTFSNHLIPFNIGNQLDMSLDANNELLIFGYLGMVNFDGITFNLIMGLPFSSVSVAQRDLNGKIYTGFWGAGDTLFIEFDPASSSWYGIKTSNSFLDSNYGWDVDIDSENNRWFITSSGGGLTKFDGAHWTNLTTANSGIPDNSLRCLFFDSNNNFWIGLQTSSPYPLAKFDGINWEYFDLAPLFSGGSGEVYEVAEDQNGDIWAAVSAGIARYSAGSWTYYNSTNLPVASNLCQHIEVDKLNNVWAYFNMAGLLKFDGSVWTAYNTSNSGLLDNTVADITFDSNNHLWLVADNKVVQKFDGLTWTSYPSSITGITYPLGFGIEYNELDNTIWISTYFEFIKYNGNTWERFDPFNSAISTGGRKTVIDKYNNKWMVTWNSGFVVYNENGIDYETIYNNGSQSITGKVFYDSNFNGIFDTLVDHGVSTRKIMLLSDSTLTYTTSNGNYFYNRDSGNYEVTYLPDPNWYITSDSASYHISIDSINVSDLNFGTLFNGFENQAVITSVALNDDCNEEGAHIITYRNEGTTILNGTIKYVSDTLLTFISAVPNPDVISGDTLIWNYVNLLPFEERQIVSTFMNPGPQPGTGGFMNSGVSINFNQTLLCTDTAFQAITCSWDPNDKQVYPIGVGVNHEILPGDSLTYTIRFQNTGNDTASFVMLVDTLSFFLDMNTFEFLSSSHDVQISCNINGLVTFVFNNIGLLWSSFNEPASHGYVKFRIKPKNNLSLPVTITNSALIFFDFNPYILTNTVSNNLVISYTGLQTNHENSKGFTIYPNPTDGNFNIKFFENYSGGVCRIYNATGKLVREQTILSGEVEMKTEIKSPGLYLVSFYSGDDFIFHEKIIVR